MRRAVVVRVTWGFALLGGLVGALAIVMSQTHMQSGAMRAESATIACAFALIPYVIARAVEGMSSAPKVDA